MDVFNSTYFDKNYNTKSFSQLNDLINSNNDDITYLNHDYAFDLSVDYNYLAGINITHAVEIDGQGHTIDADNLARIFIAFNREIYFKNLILINAYSPRIIGAISGGNCINCTFRNNRVKEYGGAVYGSDCVNCTFTNNSAFTGGAIYNGVATNCTFINNHARTGVVYGGWVIGSVFINNTANDGAGIADAYAAINCIFINNTASGSGGALSSCNANNCTFINNSAANQGGAINSGDANDCTFISNSAKIGGAVAGRDKVISNCEFINNTATYGGAVYQSIVSDCNFTNNTASENGGAVSNSTVFNSQFINNTARNGGAIEAIRVVNSTFTGNKALNHGGAIYNGLVSDDCIFNDNTPENTFNTTQYIASQSKTFQDLYNLINSNNNSDVYLNDNYTFNILTDIHLRTGITVNRCVTIHGQGFTVDA